MQVVRFDQWLFDNAFTHALGMLEGGEIQISDNALHFEESNPAFLGFVNEDLKDAFATLRLSYDALGFPGAYHPRNTAIWMRSFGQKIWNRTAFQAGGKTVAIQPGATIWEYNAYLAYNAGEEGGHGQAAAWYNQLRRPLHVSR